MEPKAEAQLHSWQCKADLYADDGKNALLYSPALVLSALLFNEWAFWFKGWDPIISLLLGITPTCTFKKKTEKSHYSNSRHQHANQHADWPLTCKFWP
jgi:hypothetical protein